MTEKLRLRCSALPLAFKCAGSARRGPLVIDETHEAGALGTATHEALAKLIDTGRVDWEVLPTLAAKHEVDEAELRSLVALGAKLWDSVKESFPMASTEVALSYEDGA